MREPKTRRSHMKITLEGETQIRLDMREEEFGIASDGIPVSPYHLLAGSLASCTALTVQSWAESVDVGMNDLEISIRWEMAEDRPKRVTRMDMDLHWPSLPGDRLETAERVAALCPIDATLRKGTDVVRRISRA
jgi:uncharacterized OsmC-like protein